LSRKILISSLLLATLLSLAPVATATTRLAGSNFTASSNHAESALTNLDSGQLLNRGEAVDFIVASFKLKNKFKKFISSCARAPDECFFAFSAMSHYNGIQFSPLILYPDVFPAHKNYSAINIATMLNLVRGFLDEPNSPFHPEIGMTKIQALKVVLGASDQLRWKDKFEMTSADYHQDLPYSDKEIYLPENWWYGRYMDFALQKGIIDKTEFFGCDQIITKGELAQMVARTLALSEVSAKESDLKLIPSPALPDAEPFSTPTEALTKSTAANAGTSVAK